MNKTEIIEVLNDITWNSNGRYSVEVMNECRREAIAALSVNSEDLKDDLLKLQDYKIVQLKKELANMKTKLEQLKMNS